MSAAEDCPDIIILSDDEEVTKESENDLSCLIVEEEKKDDHVAPVVPPTVSDEDLVVTFSRRADVLPHARYDCPIHPFTVTANGTSAPLAGNQHICDQCFCYICDKLASSCGLWCRSGACHCNAHKKSEFWNSLRNTQLLGELQLFNLTLAEIDSHLRYAETMLQIFRRDLSSMFLVIKEQTQQEGCKQKDLVINFTAILNSVTAFLDTADKQDNRAAAIMNLGAGGIFMKHFRGLRVTEPMSISYAHEIKLMILQRVMTSVRRLIVTASFAPGFVQCLQEFYKKSISVLVCQNNTRISLFVRSWDDVLLVSVLKGQNVSGVRKDKGKKDQLTEQLAVVILRSEVLQRQSRYRELSRYLRVVQTDDPARFQKLQDLIPYFLCLEADFQAAIANLFSSVNMPAGRLTPKLFHLYFHIFNTATAPRLTVSQPEQLCCPKAAWEPIKDAVPLKRVDLVKFTLRAQMCSYNVYADSQCWTCLLLLVNTSSHLPEPSPQFLHDSQKAIDSILRSQRGSNLQIPRSFQESNPDQALLLLVSRALLVRIQSSTMFPALPVLNTYKNNLWALKWLCDALGSSDKRLQSFLQEVSREVANSTGVELSPLGALFAFKPHPPGQKTPKEIQWDASSA